MKQSGRFVLVPLTAMVFAAGCGNGSGPSVTAASVTGVAGGNQTAPTGATLTFPLSLVALGSGGQPVQGIQVAWSVTPVGAATFNPLTSTTDASGSAVTNVTTGTFIGAINIHAAVPGVPDVVYPETVVDPCFYVAPYTLGTTVNGDLTSADCNRNNFGFFYDFDSLSLATGQHNIRIAMHSTFATWLDLWSAAGPYVAFDDDSILNQQQNSQIDIILPGDDYIIGASSFGPRVTGSYSLSTSNRTESMSGCRQVWVMRGVSVSDSITASDCADSSVTPHHYDVARIIVFAGTVLSIAERSTAMNPSLALYKVVVDSGYRRHLVASNDDSSAGNPNAFIAFTVDSSNVYDIIIGTSAAGETGAYTFDVLASTTLSPRVSAPRATARDWWRNAGQVLRSSKL